MKLYHGTSERKLPSILQQGIKPRHKGAGNWCHSIESNPDFTYLTNAYALYFAGNAVKGGERLAVIEVDADRLDPLRLAPDEDWLEQATRGQDRPGALAPADKPMKYRTRWYRRRLKNVLGTGYWQQSLNGLGTCNHYGTIPVVALTRVALVEFDTYMRLLLEGGLDPSISLMNYKIVGQKYRNASAWLFDGIEPPDTGRPVPEEAKAAFVQVWSRDGIEVRQVNEMMVETGE